jgi:hypothetical protein
MHTSLPHCARLDVVSDDEAVHPDPHRDSAEVDAGEVIATGRRAGESDDTEDITSMVEQPAKVMRIGTMIKQLLEEVRAAPLDEAGRQRLREIHETAIGELADGLAPELRDELSRLTLPFGSGVPSEAELRITQAQLVGWLEGLFHGIQTALMAQQMAARQQLEGMRRALPGDAPRQLMSGPGGQLIVAPEGYDGDEHSSGTGQYL